MCDLLLVFYCNCMPVLYHFRDITIYWLKNLLFGVFTTQVSFKALVKVFNCDLGYKIWSQKLYSMVFRGEIRMVLRLVLSQ